MTVDVQECCDHFLDLCCKSGQLRVYGVHIILDINFDLILRRVQVIDHKIRYSVKKNCKSTSCCYFSPVPVSERKVPIWNRAILTGTGKVLNSADKINMSCQWHGMAWYLAKLIYILFFHWNVFICRFYLFFKEKSGNIVIAAAYALSWLSACENLKVGGALVLSKDNKYLCLLPCFTDVWTFIRSFCHLWMLEYWQNKHNL